MMSLGLKYVEKENECSINICGDFEEASSYYYDEYDGICYCMDYQGEIVEQEYIG